LEPQVNISGFFFLSHALISIKIRPGALESGPQLACVLLMAIDLAFSIVLTKPARR
jgi:hypothetical protein